MGKIGRGAIERCRQLVVEIRGVGSSLSDAELGRISRLETMFYGSTYQPTSADRKALAQMYVAHCPDGDNIKHARKWAK